MSPLIGEPNETRTGHSYALKGPDLFNLFNKHHGRIRRGIFNQIGELYPQQFNYFILRILSILSLNKASREESMLRALVVEAHEKVSSFYHYSVFAGRHPYG
ncbi:MAG TPA: hypothetical protein VLA93_13560 [Pyrinomonadaceae bacterium]|nr:hypothetical protein [Pyrinomonadaceae bacterium]